MSGLTDEEIRETLRREKAQEISAERKTRLNKIGFAWNAAMGPIGKAK